ncbi:saccharopine dehydrogenase NADP-binding domain-containing protein [Alteromonadaceae bacterium BrNp21-10]|nr:saccharopine dehydrogenase NADP-binding domain-containing protein [Alteromonadaceae bacterium BrNp21-10]
MKRVLIIGGYGNFGSFISRSLAKQANINLVIAGRSLNKAQSLAEEISAEAVVMDIHDNLESRLQEIKPDIVIHTSGPFQSQGYDVAEACIQCGADYIDLADGREFVSGIDSLDQEAKQAGVLVVSGASSVPCLTSALIEHYRGEFETLESLDYGITTAQKTTRGVATTAAILSYTGKSFKTLVDGKEQNVYGWQSLRARKYSGLGWRLLGNCNVPDLELFPKMYPELKTIKFYAGLELPFIHVTLWALSWLVRISLVKSLEPSAPLLLKLSFLFDWLGSASSGFHMDLTGKDEIGKSKTIRFELTARSGDGPFIPCTPAILLAKKLANDEIKDKGAIPCVGIISKKEYLDALGELDISWTVSQL